MDITDSIINYRRFLKRRNYSKYTLRNYMNTLKHYVLWLDVPVEQVTHKKLQAFIDHLRSKRRQPKTINCYLDSIRGFYDFLIYEEEVPITNPVKRGYSLRLSQPLPRFLRDEEIEILFDTITSPRDQAMFKLMLRCAACGLKRSPTSHWRHLICAGAKCLSIKERAQRIASFT